MAVCDNNAVAALCNSSGGEASGNNGNGMSVNKNNNGGNANGVWPDAELRRVTRDASSPSSWRGKAMGQGDVEPCVPY